MTIQPGQSLSCYHVLEQLGEGGMAMVRKRTKAILNSFKLKHHTIFDNSIEIYSDLAIITEILS